MSLISQINKLPLLKKIYVYGFLGTSTTLFTGNLISAIDMTINEFERVDFNAPKFFLGFANRFNFTVMKSISYGAIWPLFFSYVCAKPIIFEQDNRRYKTYGIDNYLVPGRVNNNGLWPQFIPVYCFYYQ